MSEEWCSHGLVRVDCETCDVDALRADLARVTAERDEAIALVGQAHNEALDHGFKKFVAVSKERDEAIAEKDDALVSLRNVSAACRDEVAEAIARAEKVEAERGDWDKERAEWAALFHRTEARADAAEALLDDAINIIRDHLPGYTVILENYEALLRARGLFNAKG